MKHISLDVNTLLSSVAAVAAVMGVTVSLAGCSGGPVFMGLDKGRGELTAENEAEVTDEPVMVGGAFLTCAIIDGEFGSGPAEIGCRVAENRNRKSLDLQSYQVSWEIYDAQGELVSVPIKRSDKGGLRLVEEDDHWHVFFNYPDASYRTHTVESGVTRPADGHRMLYHKPMENFNEDEDWANANNRVSLGLTNTSAHIDLASLPTQKKGIDKTELIIKLGVNILGAAMLPSYSAYPSANDHGYSGRNDRTSYNDYSQPMNLWGLSLNSLARHEFISRFEHYKQTELSPYYNSELCFSKPQKTGQAYRQTPSRYVHQPGQYPCYLPSMEVNHSRTCAVVFLKTNEENLQIHGVALRQPGEVDPLRPTESELANTMLRFECSYR